MTFRVSAFVSSLVGRLLWFPQGGAGGGFFFRVKSVSVVRRRSDESFAADDDVENGDDVIQIARGPWWTKEPWGARETSESSPVHENARVILDDNEFVVCD